MADEVVVDVNGLVKRFRAGEREVEILHSVNLQVRRGEFVALIGQSGSGKSTLLNLLGALDRPSAGTLRIAGQQIAELSDDGLADLRGTRIGFIFQFHYLLDEFTCRENALMPIILRKGLASREDVAHVTGLLQRVGLGHRLDSMAGTMSGGEQQRTAVVRALANNPALVLADEPTGNLDSTSGREVFKLMREMNRESGVAFIMATHDERMARAADRVLHIEDGTLHEEAVASVVDLP